MSSTLARSRRPPHRGRQHPDQAGFVVNRLLFPYLFDAVALCLGGGSWEKRPVRWPEMLRGHGVEVADLRPSNIGFRVSWPEPQSR